MSRPVVMKFGGASLACAGSMLRVVELIQLQQKTTQVFVIVSGCGNVTNELETMLSLPTPALQRQALAQIQQQHLQLIHHCADVLQAEAEISYLLQRVSQMFEQTWQSLQRPGCNPNEILTLGERLSAQIVCAILQVLGLSCSYLNATDYICLAGDPSLHRPDLATCMQLCRQAGSQALQVNVSEGFIARSANGQIATLGRNGSDTSAVLWAVALGATRLEIWKEVDGLFDADPNIVADASLITDIAFDDLCVLSQFGSAVIHYPALQLLKHERLILSLRCPKHPNSPKSTHIHFGGERPAVTALAVLNDVQIRPNQHHSALYSIDKGKSELRFVMDVDAPTHTVQCLQVRQQTDPLMLLTVFSNQLCLQGDLIEQQLLAAGIEVLAVCPQSTLGCVNVLLPAAQKAPATALVYRMLHQQSASRRAEENDVF